MTLAASAQADHSQVYFQIETRQLLQDGEQGTVVPDAIRDRIEPVGRGDASDVDCEGQSNSEGVVNCVVLHCDEDDALANIYLIHFQPPSQFAQVEPAKVHVHKCEITPLTIVAGFWERTLVGWQTDKDIETIFGVAGEDITDEVIASVSIEAYSAQVHEILKQPLGAFRASNVRRFVQDGSAVAVSQGNEGRAVAYQRLAIAHANAVLSYAAGETLVAGTQIEPTARLATLLKNIQLTAKAWAEIDIASPPDAKGADLWFVPGYSVALGDVYEAVSNGFLANQEFQQLEAITSSIHPGAT